MMKTFILFLIFPITLYAQFSKPELLARYAGSDNFNMPQDTTCFFSEPAVSEVGIFIGCHNSQGAAMMKWIDGLGEIVASAEGERLFSYPQVYSEGVAWYEFDQMNSTRSFTGSRHDVQIQDIMVMGTPANYLPLGNDQWVYLVKKSHPELWLYHDGRVTPFFTQKVAYIFTPGIGARGEMAIKVRKNGLNENEADEIWSFQNGNWKKILEDIDANPASSWKSFRHQLSVSGNKVVTFATDGRGEALILIEGDNVSEIARPGSDIKSFDHFSAKVRGDTIVFRGVDQLGRKAVWAFAAGKLKRLVTQGDIVNTDKGLARVHYSNEHSIFYGAPSIGPEGEIVLQATLSDADHLNTLIGVGLLRFKREL